MRPERARRAALLCAFALAAAAAALAPRIAPAPNRIDLDRVLAAPSPAHVLGTDGLGRDVLARLVHGARVSLAVGAATALIALILGLPLGALAGYRGGAWDVGVSRLIEASLCFPSILIALALLTVAPPWLRSLPDAIRIAIALGVLGWTPAARFLRAEFARLRDSEAALAARAAGAGPLRLIFAHLLPRSLGAVLVATAFTAGAAALGEATLSFIGVGVSPPTATWGEMLYEAMRHMGEAWWLAVFPGLALFATVYGFNRLAEEFRDWLDPRPHLL